MTGPMNVPLQDLAAIAPCLALLAGAVVVLAADLWARTEEGRASLLLPALVAVVTAGVFAFQGMSEPAREAFHGAIRADAFASTVALIIAVATGLAVLASQGDVGRLGLPPGEYYALLLVSAAATTLTAAAGDLLTLFLAIETLSIPVYALVAIHRRGRAGDEAALKYLVLGAFATGFLLYGVALLYGASGGFSLAAVATAPNASLATVGVAFVLVGLAFKAGAVPFHWWQPDAYEGAPTAVTAFMATCVKAGAFAALLRFLLAWPAGGSGEMPASAVGVLAILTMIVGNVLAVRQRSLKRMLAYSSIAHSGYLLVGVASAFGEVRAEAVHAVVFYLFVYALMTLGAFAVPIFLARGGEDLTEIEDYRGLAARRPWTAIALTTFLVALAGVPPTAGFAAKLGILHAAIASGAIGLALVAIATSVISLWYYLRPVIEMWMRPAAEPASQGVVGDDGGGEERWGTALALVITGVLVIVLGVLPGGLLDLSLKAW